MGFNEQYVAWASGTLLLGLRVSAKYLCFCSQILADQDCFAHNKQTVKP